MTFKELSNTLTDYRFAVLRVVKMILDQAILADQRLMLLAKFRCDLVWVTSFFNLLSSLLISNKLSRFLIVRWRTVIRVTEGAFELAFDNKFLALTFDHLCFHTVTARSLTATHQINGLSVSKVELKLAERAFEERRSEGLHNYIS